MKATGAAGPSIISINENEAGSCTWQSARVLLLIDNGDGIVRKTHGPVLNYTETPWQSHGPRTAQYGTGWPETLCDNNIILEL